MHYGQVVMLMCVLEVIVGQHGHSDWSVVIHSKLEHLFIIAGINFMGHLCYSVGLEQTGYPLFLMCMSERPAVDHLFSFLGPVFTGTDA